MAVFKAANLQLLSLETEDFALIRSLVGTDPSPLLLVDLGATTSTMIVVQNGLPLFHRSLEHGGVPVTKALAPVLDLELESAEQFKKDLVAAPETKFLPAIQAALNPVLNEIKYTFNLWQRQHPGLKLEKVILTGGTSLLPQLSQFLADILAIKVYLGDPWARVIYPEELKPTLDVLGAKMSIAVGLAMREII